MKSVILLKMRLWVFLTEIPLIILLLVCKNVNEGMDELFGLWPLMIALGALIVFLAVYFFRLVSVSWLYHFLLMNELSEEYFSVCLVP